MDKATQHELWDSSRDARERARTTRVHSETIRRRSEALLQHTRPNSRELTGRIATGQVAP
jgi:hypothetical protein